MLGVAENLPRAHSVQVEAPSWVEPVSWPVGQVRHLLSVAPGGFQVPTLHLAQVEAPLPFTLTVMAPGPQSVHWSLNGWSE